MLSMKPDRFYVIVPSRSSHKGSNNASLFFFLQQGSTIFQLVRPMQYIERPRPEEVQFYQTYATELKKSFQSGLLKELVPYPHFVVWRHRLIEGKYKKPPYNPKSHYPAEVDNS